jgi:hypothetical protein
MQLPARPENEPNQENQSNEQIFGCMGYDENNADTAKVQANAEANGPIRAIHREVEAPEEQCDKSRCACEVEPPKRLQCGEKRESWKPDDKHEPQKLLE